VNETELTVVGNIVNSPQRSRLPSGDSVTNFRMASTSRRFDRETQAWTDHRTFFVDVECWGELGGNVSHTLSKGDPVVVKGEIYTHAWDSEQGRRSRPQLRAAHVGPDLTRGVADFRRSARAVPQAEPAGEPDAGPAEDPYADRPTDYIGAEEALHEVDPDLTGEPALEPALT
jgi:single-strand DNA-binding protein